MAQDGKWREHGMHAAEAAGTAREIWPSHQ
jgi:hypothetical protein